VLNPYLKSNRNAKLELKPKKNLLLERLVETNVVVEEKDPIVKLPVTPENVCTDPVITTTTPFMLVI
jgi:hypothetical protein